MGSTPYVYNDEIQKVSSALCERAGMMLSCANEAPLQDGKQS